MSFMNQKRSTSQIQTHLPASGHQSSLIGKTLLINGEVRSEDEILIEGKIEGRVTVKNGVVIGKNGIIEGDIEAREIVIKGKVCGNVKASQKVEIVPEGVLNGNISAPKVVISEGAIFEGSIDMKPKNEKHSLKEEKQVESKSGSQGGMNGKIQKV